MSNIKSITRRDPLSRTVVTGAWTTTPGKSAVTKATEAALATNARGAVLADAHFSLVGSPAATAMPCRYLSIGCVPTGTDKANVDAYLVVQQWHAVAEMWMDSAPMRILGATGIDNNQTDYGCMLNVQVQRGCIAGRFYLRALAADQGIDFVVDADNDD